MNLVSATILLMLVIAPFGNMPLVISVPKGVDSSARVRVVLRECTIAYAVPRAETERFVAHLPR